MAMMTESDRGRIIPAIDLLDGRVVRLFQGDYDKVTHYDFTIDSLLGRFSSMGFRWVHVVDLTAARAKTDGELFSYLGSDTRKDIERSLMTAHNDFGLDIELCGGIRRLSDARFVTDGTVQRLCVGSKAYTSPGFLEGMCAACGPERVSLGMDLRNDVICIHGWEESVDTTWQSFLLSHRDCCRTVVCTDILRDGTRQGCSLGLYERMCGFLRDNNIACDVIASGGVSMDDLDELGRIGVSGAIMGKHVLDNISL